MGDCKGSVLYLVDLMLFTTLLGVNFLFMLFDYCLHLLSPGSVGSPCERTQISQGRRMLDDSADSMALLEGVCGRCVCGSTGGVYGRMAERLVWLVGAILQPDNM